MYLWIGCRLPEEFEKEIRQHCLALNEQVGLDTVAFDLPQHISLKISFQTGQVDAVLDALSAYLAQQTPFSVELTGAEQNGSILWLPAGENPHLQRMHRELDSLLERRFGIPQHPFDRDFLFHSTLFMDSDTEKIARMAQLLATRPVPPAMTVNTFLLGQSETGKPGTCRIIREITV